ncbi:MAG: hypothetical protein ACJ78Q_00245 [Chloroflexia bacterium]
MNETKRYELGEFDSCSEAVAACKRVVDEFLLSGDPGGKTAEELWEAYVMFGEDPFIVTTDPDCTFSAWDYSKERCAEICRPGSSTSGT